MRGPRNFRQGWGWSTSIWQKSSDNFVCLFILLFFLVLSLFYRSQMVNFKEKYHFTRFRRGPNLSRGGGPTFSRGGGGVELLIPYRKPFNVIFQGGPDPLSPPLDPHLAAIYLASQSAKRCDHLLHLCLFSCNFVVCFQSSLAIKSFLELTAWLLPGLSNILHLLQFVFAFLNHSIKIAQFLFAWGHFFSFPSHFDRWCFRHQCKRMTSYPMT